VGNNNTVATNDTTGKITTTGIKSVGMSGEVAEIINRGTINVNGQEGTGMFAKSSSKMINKGTINLIASTSADKPNIGMFTEDKDTVIHNNKNIIGGNNTYGIYGKTVNMGTNGKIKVGNNSVGIYKNGSGEIKTALGSIGKTLTVADSGYGVFSKGAKLINNMNVTVGVDAIGAYVDGNDLTSTGTVTVADKGVGLLVKGTGKTLTSTGNITVGSNNSVGLYAGDNANIAQSGNITVANNNGIGVYSKGSGNVSTIGAITVGKDSIGVYKDGKGTMNINASSPIQTMTIAEKGYGLYYKGNSRADSIINSNMNKTNFVISQIIITKTFNQFNLDVVQDVEVWQAEI